MDGSKAKRMQELEAALDTRFGNRFHGSKAPRKNAEMELRKLQAEAEIERKARKASRIRSLEEVIKSLQYRLDNDYNGFWWEIPGIKDPREVRKELDDAKRELTMITG